MKYTEFFSSDQLALNAIKRMIAKGLPFKYHSRTTPALGDGERLVIKHCITTDSIHKDAIRNAKRTLYIVYRDMPDGERLYWTGQNGWFPERDMAREFRFRPNLKGIMGISVKDANESTIHQFTRSEL